MLPGPCALVPQSHSGVLAREVSIQMGSAPCSTLMWHSGHEATLVAVSFGLGATCTYSA